MKNKKVIIRTLDIGGDKKLNYFNFPKELNPFLGYRAIRMSLDKKDIFNTQLKALLRASIHGNLAIMFPLIATINEFLEVKNEFEKAKKDLDKQKIKYSNNIEIGIMIEVPATALIAKQFAKYVDFFSIGTNDLMQYTMAADRMNENVSYLYQPLNPSILKLIKMTIEGAHLEGK
jgi:phosphotransferase system enzyme I (PtsI)